MRCGQEMSWPGNSSHFSHSVLTMKLPWDVHGWL